MGILGNYQVNPDKYRQRGYSLYAEYLVGERTGVGISSMVTKAKKDRITLEPEPTASSARRLRPSHSD